MDTPTPPIPGATIDTADLPPRQGRRVRNVLLVAGAVVALVAVLVTMIASVFAAMRASEPYQMATAAYEASPHHDPAGSYAWLFSGSISTEMSSGKGDAELFIPIRGSRNAALDVTAKRTAGIWGLTTLTLTLRDGSTIDLLAAHARPDSGPEPTR